MSTTSSRPSTNKVLFILSSFDHFVESGKPTGWYLSEAAHPYHVLTAAGKEIVFASPSGGAAPLDPSSIEAAKDDKISLDFLHGETTKAAVANTLPLSSIKYDDFDAVFAVGGHGPLFDLATDKVSIKLIEEFFATGRPLAAVCHGIAAFHQVKDTTGESIFKGRSVTAFSNQEEGMVQLTSQVPFSIEEDIAKQGGTYAHSRSAFGEEVVVDRTGGKLLITGGNPASATKVAEEILAALKA